MAEGFDVEHIPVNKRNLSATLLSSSISSSTETITVDSASVLPSAKFYATITPANGLSNNTNSEIILVRSVSGNTLTVTRGQRGTTARAFDAGAVLFNSTCFQDTPYDASEILTTQNETYTDVQGLIAAINDGRPIIMNTYYGTDDMGGQTIVTSAQLVDMMGISQTITIQYLTDNRIVRVTIDPSTGAITRSGSTICTTIMSPGTTVLQDIGTIASNTSTRITSAGFLVGKAYSSAGYMAMAWLDSSRTIPLAGIPYNQSNGNIQVAFCVPVRAFQQIYWSASGSGKSQLETVKVVNAMIS